MTIEDERSFWQRYYEEQMIRYTAAILRHFKATQVELTPREMMAPGVVDMTRTPEGNTFVRIKDTFLLG